VTVAYTKQYGDFRYMPQRYVDLVDNDFLKLVNVFLKHILILSRLPYIQMKQEFITFECDSPATNQRIRSYSRFMVPAVVSIPSRDFG
jgi:hypothetical protein